MVTVEFDVDWSRVTWIAFGVVLAAAVLWVTYSFVGTVVFGVFIYYATRRLYRRVRGRVGQASVAAGLSLLLLALPVILLLYYTLAIALEQFGDVSDALRGTQFREQFATARELLRDYPQLTELLDDPTQIVDAGSVGTATDAAQLFAGYLAELGTGLLHLFVMFAIAFYLLRDGSKLARWATHFTDRRGVLDHYFTQVDRSLDKVFYGNILNAIITGSVGAITYSALNMVAPGPVAIPYAALAGLLAGAASLIPVVGMKLVYVPLALYLAAVAAVNGEGWWFVLLFAAVSFVIVDTIPDLVVRPYVSGGNLHVGALMFAYILGPLLWGWYGIFLGPILLVLVVHFARTVAPELLSGTPIEPYSVDPSNVVATGEPPSAVANDDVDELADGGSAEETDSGD